MADDMPQVLASGDLESERYAELSADPDFRLRLFRIRLAAGPHGSSKLVETLKRLILRIWFDTFHADIRKADRRTMYSIQFTLGGMLAVLGDRDEFPDDMEALRYAVDSRVRGTAVQDIANRLKAIGA